MSNTSYYDNLACTCDPRFEPCQKCAFDASQERLRELEKQSHITDYYYGKDQGAYGRKNLVRYCDCCMNISACACQFVIQKGSVYT